MAKYDRATRMSVILALLSLLFSGFVAYTHETDDTHSRITAVEVQQKNDNQRLERIESKLDQVYLILTRP